MRAAQHLSILALGLLGMLGGCLILAENGFTTSSKRGEWSTFVPAPQAYVMAAIMFSMSVLAVIWLLKQSKASIPSYAASFLLYLAATFTLTRFLATTLQ